ncbi:MAG TPA: hypothetical protein VGC44_12120 [Longimicrobiales bacterium]
MAQKPSGTSILLSHPAAVVFEHANPSAMRIAAVAEAATRIKKPRRKTGVFLFSIVYFFREA